MNKTELASERKNQIILATIECMSRFGYHNFSMQDVARVADVSKGIIHYYFMNKEDLMMTVLNKVSGDIEELLLSTESSSDPVTRLSNAIWLCSSIVQTKREYYKINMDFWTQIDQKENVKKQIAFHYDKFRKVLGNIIQQGMTLGVFRAGNPEQYACVILAMIDGIALQWLFDETIFHYDEIIKNCESAVMSFLKIKG